MESFDERIKQLNKMIAGAKRIVFFTGAGISTGSGIPDFRSNNGLYNASEEDEPEYMLSYPCLKMEPERFFKYLRNNMDFRNAEPNIAHKKISELQQARTVSVVTQNIDGLHEKAGSKVVDTIHGTMANWYCPGCLCELFIPEDVMDGMYDDEHGVPKCPLCDDNFTIRPDITLYGESLPSDQWQMAMAHVAAADLMIIVGTSLAVAPANLLPNWFRSDNIVVINRDEIERKDYIPVKLRFTEDICEVFERVEIPND